MSAAPFDIGLVIERIAAADTGLRSVQGSADYAQIKRLQDFPAPCGYVVLAQERPTQTKSGISMPGQQTPLAQMVQVTFGVITAVRNYRQMQGDALRNELREQIGAIRNTLLGWTPPVSGGRALQLHQGDLGDYDNAVALWIDVYRTQHAIKPEIKP